jgi:uncharacterized membrane protein YhhN
VNRPARAAYAVAAAVDTALAARQDGAGPDRARWLTKPLLMPLLAVGRDRPTQAALGLSTVGDLALLRTSERAFLTGLGSFLAAQVAWVRALRERPGGGAVSARPALALPYVAVWAGMNAVLWPRAGKDRVPVAVYSAVLTAMAVAARDTGDPRAAAGGALFLASDGLIALDRFAGVSLPRHEGWVMGTYTAAQALLAAGGTAD